MLMMLKKVRKLAKPCAAAIAAVLAAMPGSSSVEATAATLGNLIGLSAAEPSGNEVVYYLTGEFFTQGLNLPTGVTAEALKLALRKTSIFLKEVNLHE